MIQTAARTTQPPPPDNPTRPSHSQPSDEQWNNRRIPAVLKKQPAPYLLEFVAVNMHERSSSHRDLDRPHSQLVTGGNGAPAIGYRIAKASKDAYAAWSHEHVGHATAIIVNDEVISAPIFASKIIGYGITTANFTATEAKALVRVLRDGPMPAKPTLASQEPRPSPSTKGKAAARR